MSLTQNSKHLAIAQSLMDRWPESKPEPSLARIQAFCELLGDPHKSAPVIQVAGTNGKGSTAIMIDALLRSVGLSTGRMVSPHLADVTERICINGKPIAIDIFDALVEESLPLIEMVDAQKIDGVPMTFFEVMVGLGFAAFAQHPVDVMILEVGLGGSWDATNIADADVAVITPIGLDHTHILGETLAEIAAEKAGIIKAKSIAVVAPQELEAAQVIFAKCQEKGAAIVLADRDFQVLNRQLAVGGQLLRLEAPIGIYEDVYLPVYGEYMAQNAALALAAVAAFLGSRELQPEIITEAFAAVEIPARLETLRTSPTILVDTAHNPQAIANTLQAVGESYDFNALIIISAMMADKDVARAVELYSSASTHFIATEIAASRCLSAVELAEIAENYYAPEQVQIMPDLADAIDTAVMLADQETGNAGILFIGSVIAAGEFRELLRRKDKS